MKVTAMKNVHSRAAGFSLIEVMIAVVVLAFGLVSLAALQGRLFQSGAESKARAAATSIAQQALEDARFFAFVTPPTGYTGPTYISLADGGPWTFSAGGVAFTSTRTVKRYRYVDANPADATPGTFVAAADTTNYSGGVPEFKQVDVSVGWTGSDGQPKTVLMTDSIAAVAPADAVMLRKLPSEATGGPQVWIEPPNKDNPQVVPIGIGGDQSAASSNPKPEQFVKSDAAVTHFSVITFTGSDPTQVLLNRKVDVSAATCVCQSGGTSSAINPTYQPTVWNGMQQAYVDPQALPSGTPIGTPVVANAESEIEPTCTVCCRDHHENEKRTPRPDPYRALTGAEVGGNEHYVYNGSSLMSAGSGRYVDSCQVIRVGGRLRMATDAMQNSLVVTPLNSLATGYRIPGFANSYADYVTSSITAGMAVLPTGYLAPTARFPGPDTTVQATYSGIVDPVPIALATGETVPLVAFGLYVDYLSPETRKAYQCARDNDTSSGCAGLGALDPLQVLPFYAVNVANLYGGSPDGWNSEKPTVAAVSQYATTDGYRDGAGVVTALAGNSAVSFKISHRLNKSNSGLAATDPVDPDDAAGRSNPDQANDPSDDANLASYAMDWLQFTKGASTGPAPTPHTLTMTIGTQERNLSGISVDLTGKLQCSGFGVTTTCTFTDDPAMTRALTFTSISDNQNLSNGNGNGNGNGNSNNNNSKDFKICVSGSYSFSTTNDALTSESQTFQLGTFPSGADQALTVHIVLDTTACPTGTSGPSP